jgi:hypothetical protein
MSLALDSSGDIYVAGLFQQAAHFDAVTLTSAGADDIFVVKYRPDGSVEWGQRGGGCRYETIERIGVTGSGTVYTMGSFDSTSGFGGTSLSSLGGRDLYLWKLDGSTIESGVAEGERGDAAGVEILRVAPNPVNRSGEFLVELREPARASIVMIDMLGREVATLFDGELSAGHHTLQVDATTLTAGLYYVMLTTPTVRRAHRIDIVK